MSSKCSNNKQTGINEFATQDFDIEFLQSGFFLHHRTEANRQIQVQISDSKQVEKPAFLNKCKDQKIQVPDGVDQLSCEIIGLDCKKSKKPVKIRFHPEVLKVAKRDAQIALLIYNSAKKLIDEFLSQEWTMEQPDTVELPKSEVDALRSKLIEGHINMSFNEKFTEFHWQLENAPKFLLPLSQQMAKKSKKRNTSVAAHPNVKFELHVHPIHYVKLPSNDSDKTLCDMDNDQLDSGEVEQSQQCVEIRLLAGRNSVHTLFSIDFQSHYPLVLEGKESTHFARFVPELGMLHIHLQHCGQKLPVSTGQSSVSINGCQNKMIDCVQLRLELLRHHVRRQNHQDNLLAQSQQPACTPHFPNELGPIAAAFHNNSRTVLFQLTNTNRPLPMSRFTVTPVVTNHQPPVNKVQKQAPANNRMLHVRVHNELKNEQASEACSGSPSESIDSGMGMPSSPTSLTTENDEDTLDTLSPLLSASPMISQLNNRFHFGATAHSSPANQPMFRSRSASECLEFRQSSTLASSNNGSSNSSLSPNGTPLRSILKKPKVLAPGLGNTSIVAASTNGLRRAPTRYVLSRSVSECHDDQVLIDNDLQLIDNEIVSMEDLSVCNGSPLSVVDEESCESNSSDEPMKSVSEQHKKRVSFNEQVMARIYRSNSSIIATKNKQERKLRNRLRRRAESESSEPVTVDDLVRIPTIPLSKLSAEEKDQDGSPNCDDDQKDSLPVNERRDSGFDSNDSGMESPEEAMQVETSAKRVQRVISSDSAFGDELME